ncbi:hypothetical protein D3C76_1538710 [compost metagenome]
MEERNTARPIMVLDPPRSVIYKDMNVVFIVFGMETRIPNNKKHKKKGLKITLPRPLNDIGAITIVWLSLGITRMDNMDANSNAVNR